jgi:hypothetical protein
MLGRAFGHEKVGLHPAAGDDRGADREHQAGDESPVRPETNAARLGVHEWPLPGARYFTFVVR